MEMTLSQYAKTKGVSYTYMRKRLDDMKEQPQTEGRRFDIDSLDRIFEHELSTNRKIDRKGLISSILKLRKISLACEDLGIQEKTVRNLMATDEHFALSVRAAISGKEIEPKTKPPHGAHYLLDGMYYRIGKHDRVFFFDGTEWVSSTSTLSRVRKGSKI